MSKSWVPIAKAAKAAGRSDGVVRRWLELRLLESKQELVPSGRWPSGRWCKRMLVNLEECLRVSGKRPRGFSRETYRAIRLAYERRDYAEAYRLQGIDWAAAVEAQYRRSGQVVDGAAVLRLWASGHAAVVDPVTGALRAGLPGENWLAPVSGAVKRAEVTESARWLVERKEGAEWKPAAVLFDEAMAYAYMESVRDLILAGRVRFVERQQ